MNIWNNEVKKTIKKNDLSGLRQSRKPPIPPSRKEPTKNELLEKKRKKYKKESGEE